jgi:hypothetical protein
MFMDALTLFHSPGTNGRPFTAYVFIFLAISKPGYGGAELRPPKNANS